MHLQWNCIPLPDSSSLKCSTSELNRIEFEEQLILFSRISHDFRNLADPRNLRNIRQPPASPHDFWPRAEFPLPFVGAEEKRMQDFRMD